MNAHDVVDEAAAGDCIDVVTAWVELYPESTVPTITPKLFITTVTHESGSKTRLSPGGMPPHEDAPDVGEPAPAVLVPVAEVIPEIGLVVPPLVLGDVVGLAPAPVPEAVEPVLPETVLPGVAAELVLPAKGLDIVVPPLPFPCAPWVVDVGTVEPIIVPL